MEQDVLKGGIAVMAMRTPAGGLQVDLHVAGLRRGPANLNDGAAKIRPAFDAHKTGMQDADSPAIGGAQPVATEALMTPDGLEEPFGRHIGFVAQDASRAFRHPPAGVKIFEWRGHVDCFCAGGIAKSSRHTKF